MAEEVIEEYKSSLLDLTFNSKPHINMLTMLAEDNTEHAAEIVATIEQHLQKAKPNVMLPVLYLMDSITKNVPNSGYIDIFAKNLVHTFCFVFDKVDEKTRQAMWKLRQTWVDIIPNKKLYALDMKVQGLDPAWPITATVPDPEQPATIHVNPKFLKQREQEQAEQREKERLEKELLERERAAQEKESALMQQQLLAKQQELLKLQQQRLEVELAEAKARLEQQAREIEMKERQLKEKDADSPLAGLLPPSFQGAAATKPSIPAAPKVVPSSGNNQVSSTIKSTAPAVRDPRLARITGKTPRSANSSPIPQNAEIVQPQPTKTSVPAKIHPAKLAAAIDPRRHKESSPIPPPGKPKSTAKEIRALKKEDPRKAIKKENERKNVNKEIKAEVKRDSSEEKDEETLQIRPKQDVSKRKVRSPRNYRKSKRSESPDRGRLHRRTRSRSRSHSPSESRSHSGSRSRSRSPRRSPRDSPRSNRSGHRRHSKERENRDRRYSREREEGKGGSRSSPSQNEADVEPPPKKARQDSTNSNEDKENDQNKLSEEFADLFGTEDQDYRKLPPIPKRRQTVPPATSPGTGGWAKFKASRPEDFPFQMPRPMVDIPSSPHDVDLRSPSMLSPPLGQITPTSPYSTSPISPDQAGQDQVPRPLLLDQADQILREAERQLQSGKLSPQQHQELIRQLDQLYKLQKLKQMLREQRNNSAEDLKKEEEAEKVYVERVHKLRNVYESPPHSSGMSVAPRQGRPPIPLRLSPLQRPPQSRRDMPPPPRPPLHLRQRQSPLRPPGPPPAQVWQMYPGEFTLPYDMDVYYVPSHDPRWWTPQLKEAEVEHQIILDDRMYDFPYDGRVREIPLQGLRISVKADPVAKEIYINGKFYYRIGEPVREFVMHGKGHKILYHGPMKKLWVDGFLYEIQADAPPTKILLAGDEHEMRIDSVDNTVLIDNYVVCQYGEPRRVIEVGTRTHDIQFVPPPRQILIDGKLCELDLTSKNPFVRIEGVKHAIRFDGSPREIFINDKLWTVSVDRPRKVKFSARTHIVALGGPGHEIIIDGKWHEVKFNGQQKHVQVGGRMVAIRLEGPPPEVKILGEFIESVDKIKEITQGFRIDPTMAIDASFVPAQRPPVPSSGGVGPPGPTDQQLRPGPRSRPPQEERYRSPLDGPSKYQGPEPMDQGMPPRSRSEPMDQGIPLRSSGVPSLLDMKIPQPAGVARNLPAIDKPRSPGQQGPPEHYNGPVPEDPEVFEGSNRKGGPRGPIYQGPGGPDYQDKEELEYQRHQRTDLQGPGTRPQTSDFHRHQGQDFHGEGPRHQSPDFQGQGPRHKGQDFHRQGPRHQGPDFHGKGPRHQGSEYPGQGPRHRGPDYQGRGPRQQGQAGQDYQGPNGGYPGPGMRGPMPRGYRAQGGYDGPRGQMRGPQPDGWHPMPPGGRFRHPGPDGFMRPSGGPEGQQMMPPGGQFDPRHQYSSHENDSHYDDQYGVMYPPQSQQQQMAPPAAAPPSIDVNDLFSKLLATGIIKKEGSGEMATDTPPNEPASTQKADEKPATSAPSIHAIFAKFEQPKKEVIAAIPDLTGFKPDLLKKQHSGVIQRLYSGIQCSSCGVRFEESETEKYREHLDWHFRQNKRDKEEMKVAKFRRWYYSMHDWIQFEEIGDMDEKAQSTFFEKMLQTSSQTDTLAPSATTTNITEPISCPAASGNDKDDVCEICGDPFEQFWDEDAEEWHLKDAIRVEEKTYHPVCYEDAKEQSMMETPDEITSPVANPLAKDDKKQSDNFIKEEVANNNEVGKPEDLKQRQEGADDAKKDETDQVKTETGKEPNAKGSELKGSTESPKSKPTEMIVKTEKVDQTENSKTNNSNVNLEVKTEESETN